MATKGGSSTSWRVYPGSTRVYPPRVPKPGGRRPQNVHAACRLVAPIVCCLLLCDDSRFELLLHALAAAMQTQRPGTTERARGSLAPPSVPGRLLQALIVQPACRIAELLRDGDNNTVLAGTLARTMAQVRPCPAGAVHLRARRPAPARSGVSVAGAAGRGCAPLCARGDVA